ncbi:hypothetical protein [Streptosporangium sp. NPDC020145]|uniref:hypothetical protein n=1 Tax=Streptosporangium sp. NPDC020145 TaxID=3154694 RepID=UPI003427647F
MRRTNQRFDTRPEYFHVVDSAQQVEKDGAFAIEAGTTFMQVYRTLYLGWGVTIPGGQCGGVAAGGHSRHSRRLGSVVDYPHAVEVVVVDRSGRARTVVATRSSSDPDHDLW